MFDGASTPGTRRGAFTLVEVILVLTLLVVIGAVIAPLLGGGFSRAGLQSAADLLRGALSRGRLAAMQSGQSYVFRFEPRGPRYQIVALEQLAMPESQETPVDNSDGEHSPEDILRLSLSRLPDGVIFSQGDIEDSAEISATSGAADGGPWSKPILFRPDGTTSDASLVLQNDNHQTIRVTLRGLTGISNSSDVEMEAAQ